MPAPATADTFPHGPNNEDGKSSSANEMGTEKRVRAASCHRWRILLSDSTIPEPSPRGTAARDARRPHAIDGRASEILLITR